MVGATETGPGEVLRFYEQTNPPPLPGTRLDSLVQACLTALAALRQEPGDSPVIGAGLRIRLEQLNGQISALLDDSPSS